MQVVCLSKTWPHHASGSGYSRLADHLDATVVARPRLDSLPARLVEKAWSYWADRRDYLYDYRFADRLAEEATFLTALRRRADITHVLNGDEQLDTLLHRRALLPGRLVATFHLPIANCRDRFERIQPELLRRVDGAIVISRREAPAFREWLGADKVVCIPHGIDIAAFTPPPPAPRAPGKLRLLFVGVHMRDFEVAHAVADRCAQAGIDIVLDVVLAARWHMFFTACRNVRLHAGIDDAALLALYRGADALVLPLIDATANNSILESLACGTPVISTAVGGIVDYVDDASGWLLPPGDVEAALACVCALAADPGLAGAKRAAARQRAETLAWPIIAGRVRQAYARLLSSGRFAEAASA